MATNRQRDARPPRATPKLHDSDVRVVSWKGMSLQQFSSTAPLFESILGPLNDGFILIKPEERILSLSLPIYVSRRYASLVGADPLELRDVPCFSMLKLNEPCEGCLGIDALESRQPMSAAAGTWT